MFGKSQREQELEKKVARLKMELGVTQNTHKEGVVKSLKELSQKDDEILRLRNKVEELSEKLTLTQMALDKSVEHIVEVEIRGDWDRRAMDLMQDDLNVCEDAFDSLGRARFLGTPSAYKTKAQEENTAEEIERRSREASARLLIKVREDLNRAIAKEAEKKKEGHENV